MKAAKHKPSPEDVLVCGLFSKKEGAQKIASGVSHVHSSVLGERDAYARITADSLKRGVVPTYPWEQPAQLETVEVATSAERYQIASTLINNPVIAGRRKIREKLEVTLEELLTNALYHAYRNTTGAEKYPRKLPVQLTAEEKIKMRFSISKEGIYLSIADTGGTLIFNDMSAAFGRTYGVDSPQIQGKEGGAGLGIFMVFEAATHFKVVCAPGKYCHVSLWIADKRAEDVDNFSFNFYSVKG